LHFLNARIESMQAGTFDHIIFAASAQYFSTLKEVIAIALGKLRSQGEIHIIDTAFYPSAEIAAAKKRSADHFKKLGFPEMSNFYFHHTMEDLQLFRHEI